MRGIGDLATLRLRFGPEPAPGDTLQTRSGRRYLVLEIRGKTLECVVIGPETETTGQEFEWTWSSRPKKRGGIKG